MQHVGHLYVSHHVSHHLVYLHVGYHVHLHVGYHNVNCNWSIPCIFGLECLAQVGLMHKFNLNR